VDGAEGGLDGGEVALELVGRKLLGVAHPVDFREAFVERDAGERRHGRVKGEE
jgi:hypothetical protein